MRLENLDFEQGDTYWAETVIGGGTSAVQTNAANARSGSKYLLLSKPSGAGFPTAMNSDKSGAQLYLPVIPGQIIQFGGWMYRESGTNVAWIAGVAYDVNKANPVFFNVQQDGTTGSWKLYTGTYKVPAGKFFVSFYMQTDQTNAATAVRYDDTFFSPGLDVQITTVGAITDQTPYLRHQSMTLKLNTFDFQLIDPTVTPTIGDAVSATDANLALVWSGVVSSVAKESVSERGGHVYVTISATNTVVPTASVAPFDLGGTQNWMQDPGFEDSDMTAVQTFWDLATPGEYSLDTVNFHGGAKSLLNTNTRQDSIQTGVWWHNWNVAQPHMPGGTAEPGIMGTQDVFPAAPGQTYTFSAWSKASAGSRANHMKILWLKDLAGNYSDIKTTDFGNGLPNGGDGPYGFTLCTVSGVAPQDARYGVLELMSGNWGNILSVNQASLETGTTGWAATLNCAVAQSAAQAFDGTKSLSLTSTAAGRMDAATPSGTSGFAVVPGDQFTASAYFRAAVTARNVHVYIFWFQSGGAASSHPNDGFAGADITSGWTQVTGTVNAPGDAAFAQVVVSIDTTGAGAEVHYVDAIGFTHGSNTNWPGINAQCWWDDISLLAAAPFRQMKYKTTQDTNANIKTSGTCITYQPGLWPIQTVDITNSDYGFLNQGFSVQDVTITWPVKFTQPVFAVTFGDSIVTMSVWQASAAQSAVLPITTTKISDEAVTTPKVAAGAITADKLTAILVLASLIKAGTGVAHVEMDGDGLRAYDGSGNIVMNIPTDGVTPITMNAQVVAQALTSTGNAIFQGARNEIAMGAILQLDASIGNPGGVPALAQTWGNVSLPINSTYDTSASVYNRASLDYDSAGDSGGATKVFWQVTNKTSGTLYALELLASDRTVNRAINLTTSGFKTVYGACRLGSYVYVLGLDGSSGSPTNFGQTGAATFSWDWSGANVDNQISTAASYAAPGAGTITSMTIAAGGHSGSVSMIFCLWNSGGSLLAQSSAFSAAAGHSAKTAALSYVCSSGEVFYFGFWRTKAATGEWGVQSSGSFDIQTTTSATSLGGRAACSGAYTCGQMQAYVTYTPDTRVARVRRFVQSTLAVDTTYTAVTYPVLVSGLPVSPAITQDGTNVFIVDRTTTIKWQKYDAAMATVGGIVDTTYNPGAAVKDASAGNADFGAWRMMVLTNIVDSFDSTPTHQTNETFSVPSAAGAGLTYGDAAGDGARFWSCPATGGSAVNLTKHSTWVWTTASSIYWVCYTYYDSAGTVHETQISPRSSLTLSRRAQLVITAPGSLPGTGGADDPNNYRFYTAPNATDPGATNFKLQATQAAATLTMTTYASGGAADPGSNNFPTGSVATIQSQTGNLKFSGDGKARFNNDMPRSAPDLSGSSFATASATQVHGGFGSSVSVTPNVTGRIRVRWSWDISDNTAGKTTTTSARYGTGTAPIAGAAVTGTQIGPLRLTGFTSGTFTYVGMIEGEVTGLTLGTAYWFDIAGLTNGGTGTWTQIYVCVEEF